MIVVNNNNNKEQQKALSFIFRSFTSESKKFFLRSDISYQFEQFCEQHDCTKPVANFIAGIQEAVVVEPWIYLLVRVGAGRWEYYRYHIDTIEAETIDVSKFLQVKERMVNPALQEDDWVLEVDFAPCQRDIPKLKEQHSIGRGVEFLNRHLSNRLFTDAKQFKFICKFSTGQNISRRPRLIPADKQSL
jgi:sucrose synthase